jgi:type IV fimbrial biogenesis protein FimT
VIVAVIPILLFYPAYSYIVFIYNLQFFTSSLSILAAWIISLSCAKGFALMFSDKRQNKNGFTLVELVVSISIAGILITIAIPSFSHIIANTKLRSQLQILFSHHQLARSEAIKTNQRITLCKSRNATQCTPESTWTEGWIVFTDSDLDKRVNNTDRIIMVQQPITSGLTLNYRGFGSFNYISYFSDGRSTTNGTFTLCNQYGSSEAKSVIISRTGRARIDNKTASKTPLRCS